MSLKGIWHLSIPSAGFTTSQSLSASQGGIQTLTATIAGTEMAFSIYMLARRGRLSFRYIVGWLLLCLFGITAGALV